MRRLFFFLLLIACASAAEKPFGYALELVQRPACDPKARCVGMRVSIKGAESAVVGDLPKEWVAQISHEGDTLTVSFVIWTDGTLDRKLAHERFAVPADQLIRSLWIQARPTSYEEDLSKTPLPVRPDVTGSIGFLGGRSDTSLDAKAFQYLFGERKRPNHALQPTAPSGRG